MEVETDFGFIPVDEINVTKPLERYELTLENRFEVDCGRNHFNIYL